MVHATPMPRNTFTALLPVTLPTEASAYLSWIAATLLANVSNVWMNEYEIDSRKMENIWAISVREQAKNHSTKKEKKKKKTSNNRMLEIGIGNVIVLLNQHHSVVRPVYQNNNNNNSRSSRSSSNNNNNNKKEIMWHIIVEFSFEIPVNKY